MSSGQQPIEGCTRHEGESIQKYCATCNELLCTQCLLGHTSEHKTIKYDAHLQTRQRDAEAVMKRVQNMKHQIDELQKRFRYSDDIFQFGIEKCEEKLSASFTKVHDAMKKWQIENENNLDRKKAVQVQNLEAAQEKKMQSVTIERPKIGIRTNARMINSLHKTVNELIPNLVLSLPGATAFPRHNSVSYSLDSSCQADNESQFVSQSDIDRYTHGNDVGKKKVEEYVMLTSDTLKELLEEGKPSTCNDKSTLGSTDTDDEGYEPIGLPPEQIDAEVKDLLLASAGPLASTYDVPKKKEVYVSMEPVKSAELEEFPPPLSPPITTPIKPNPVLPHYQIPVLSQQEPSLPPPLPPRKKITTKKKMNPDTNNIYDNVNDPKEITLEPTAIISSGYTAASSAESVELHDVCTAPLGSMIFTDPKNSCLRILMSTDERAHKITRQIKGQLQAVTYDQSNKRILTASEKGLNQLDFDEHTPNDRLAAKNFKPKPLITKEIVPLCVTTTKAGDIYATTGSSSHHTDEETFIYCFKQNGKFATKLEMKGQPYGIDYKDGYLVVANLQDNNLHKIKTNGHPIWDKYVDARQKGVLHNPFRVAILPNHNIAVSEMRRHCISVFSKEGQHVLRFGHFGEEPGMFNQPIGIAVRLDKELVVVDAGNKRIQLFALDKLNEQFEIAVAEKESQKIEIAVAKKAVADKESQEAVDKSINIYDEIADNDLEVEV